MFEVLNGSIISDLLANVSFDTTVLTLAQDSWDEGGDSWTKYFNFFDFSKGVDSVLYAWMAVGGTALFFLRLATMLFIGDIGDIDVDADGDLGDTGGFTIFSLFSIVSFFMGTGWMGLVSLYQYENGTEVTALLSFFFGTICMLLASSMLFYIKRLDSSPQVDYQTAVGATASVYMSIPAKGEGRGQVEVVVSGKKQILEASSRDEAIPAFKSVKVLSVQDDKSVVVEIVN